jgi:hypothetical protein
VFPRRAQGTNTHYIRRTVCDDWIRALPGDKNQVFEATVGSWESSFAMMSIALSDALSMRAGGKLVCARDNVSIARTLLSRVSRSLVGFCDALNVWGRHLRVVPLVEPLNTSFFRGTTGQNAAAWNIILHRVAIGDRQRFVQKLKILSGTVAQLDHEFETTAELISEGSASGHYWAELDHLHYDFNTCLREAEVVLKSFLRALPAEQLDAFAGEIQKPRHRAWSRMGLGLSRASA